MNGVRSVRRRALALADRSRRQPPGQYEAGAFRVEVAELVEVANPEIDPRAVRAHRRLRQSVGAQLRLVVGDRGRPT